MQVQVHPRVNAKRPEVTPEDVEAAFLGTLRTMPRIDTEPTQWIGVGLDSHGRLLEYVAIETRPKVWIVFHAMPATKKIMLQLGLGR